MIKTTIHNIRFWIILFFLLRLYAITNPPLEVAHNWRQTTVTMVARNFYESNANPFFPAIDIAGEKSGITGMEFPVLNYLIYLISLVFGYEHWYGRLINLIVSSIGLLYFYKLIKKYFSETLAFNATIFLLFSIWFTYSRKIMPDTFSMSLIISGIYFGTNYLDQKSSFKNLMLSFLLLLFGSLSKLPSAYLLITLTPLLLSKNIRPLTKVVFVSVITMAITLALSYYFIWVPHLNKKFGFEHFYMGTGLLSGLKDIAGHWQEAAEKFYLDALQISGFIFFIAGIWLVLKHKNKTLLMLFLLSTTAFIILMLKAGFAFYHHSYYIVPFVPVMALLAAYSIEIVKNSRLKISLLLLFCVESVLNKTHDFYIRDDFAQVITLEQELDKVGVRTDLIAINSGNVPTPMYFAHRKGWVTFNGRLKRTEYVDSLKLLGLRHIVILKKVFGENTELPYTQKIQTQDFTIYTP